MVVAHHTASSMPNATIGFHPPASHGNATADATLTSAAQHKRAAISGNRAAFHFAIGPMPIRNIAGVINGTNTASKYGAPTEIFPRPSTSSTSGYSVPRKTEAAATISKTLFDNSNASRD